MKVEIIGKWQTDDMIVATVMIDKAPLKVIYDRVVIDVDDITEEELVDIIKKNVKKKEN